MNLHIQCSTLGATLQPRFVLRRVERSYSLLSPHFLLTHNISNYMLLLVAVSPTRKQEGQNGFVFISIPSRQPDKSMRYMFV